MILSLDKHPKNTIAFLDSENSRLSYGELLDFSDSITGYIPRRSVIFLLTDNNAGGAAWSIGCINAGVVPLLLNYKLNPELFGQLYSIYRPQYICLPEKEVEKYEYPVIFKKYGYCVLKTNSAVYPVYEELSHLLPTSGSTGSPKLVRHSFQNIEAAGLNISTFFKLHPNDRALLVLPIYYTMGLSVIFSHLYAGATVLVTNVSMLDKKFWDFLKEEKATSITGVPYTFEVLRQMRFFNMDLPDLKLLTQGGGKMRRTLNAQFTEFAQATGRQWIATYGQTEGTARMTYLEPEFAVSKAGSIGKAVPNGELSLITEHGNLIETPHTEGEMCYKGKNVTLGYALTEEDLSLGDSRNGFLKTGDLAYFDEDGFYYISGRMGRFLKLYGIRVGLDECEEIVKSKFSLECACTGNNETMFVHITNPDYSKQVKDELVEKTNIVASAFEVRVIDSIPKNEAGKILYSKLMGG